MKVGILTFNYTENSGSLLQAYALQKTLNNFENIECKMINYHKRGGVKPIIFNNVFNLPLKNWTFSNIKKWSTRLIMFPRYFKKHNNFRNAYLKLFPQNEIKKNELEKLNNYFDAFIVGSDQVWNINSSQTDYAFFLDFVDNNDKKIAYAASFGENVIEEKDRQKLADEIGKFNNISVREISGQSICKELINRDVELVLDPSLLLNKEDWENVAILPNKKNYLLVYVLEKNKNVEEYINSLSQKEDLEIIRIWRSRLVDSNGKCLDIVGPLEWLGYFINAKYVVTNSFHGICFSINLHKEFFVALRNKENDSRIVSVLQRFNLENRIINLNEREKIDYIKIDNYLTEERKKSIDFLKKALFVN